MVGEEITQVISVSGHEDKNKNGKTWTRFNTSAGWFNVFEDTWIAKLKSLATGETVEVTTKERNGFNNIVSMKGVSKASNGLQISNQGVADAVQKNVERTYVKPKLNDIQVGVYVSYAKDIFLGVIQGKTIPKDEVESVMNDCINLVKQAQKAFE